MSFQHILFPIDFSARCNSTLPYVAEMAKRLDARITLLNVVVPYWYIPMPETPPVMADIEPFRLSAERQLDRTFTKELERFDVTRRVEVGDPAQIITDCGQQHGVDLVMMPTHGYGAFRQLLLGSVTAKVLHDCNTAVWTGVHLEEPYQPSHADVKTILCAVNGAANCADLLVSAAALAGRVGAKLRLVHVVPAPSAWPDRQFDAPFEAALAQDARREITDLQKSLGITAPLCIVFGDVAPELREVAIQHEADLILIGRGVIQGTLGRLRSHAYDIIRRSPCPVLSL